MRTASDFRAEARKALSERYFLAVLAALIAGVLGGAASVPSFTFRFNGEDVKRLTEVFRQSEAGMTIMALLSAAAISVGVAATLYGIGVFIVGGAVELGYDRFNLMLYTGERAAVGVLFSRFEIFGRALWLRVVMAVRIFLRSALLIVPGIVASYRYALAPYLMAENPNMTANEAIEESKRLMAGKKGRLFCMHLSFIGWWVLVLLTAGLGTVFLAPYVKAAETAFYLETTGRLPLAAQPHADAQPGAGQ